MRTLTPLERSALREVSAALGVDPLDLAAEIQRESSWNPMAKNPKSTASGLIQFMRDTAGDLHSVHDQDHDGDRDAVDLLLEYPDAPSQLRGPVLEYLGSKRPFTFGSLTDLAMSVFYPTARLWSRYSAFPERVRIANPGINTVGDYMRPLEAIRSRLKQEDIT